MTATMEITASCRTPDTCLPSLTQLDLAKDVTIALALHLADLVANWLCGILDQQAVLLFNESTAGMLQASYWVRPILRGATLLLLAFIPRQCGGSAERQQWAGPNKLPSLASAPLPSWVRVCLPVCCRFGSLPIGRFGWRPGYALLFFFFGSELLGSSPGRSAPQSAK